MHLDNFRVNYKEIVELVNEEAGSIRQETEELINIDVQRSFINMKFMEGGTVLQNMLKCYAYINADVNYC